MCQHVVRKRRIITIDGQEYTIIFCLVCDTLLKINNSNPQDYNYLLPQIEQAINNI